MASGITSLWLATSEATARKWERLFALYTGIATLGMMEYQDEDADGAGLSTRNMVHVLSSHPDLLPNLVHITFWRFWVGSSVDVEMIKQLVEHRVVRQRLGTMRLDRIDVHEVVHAQDVTRLKQLRGRGVKLYASLPTTMRDPAWDGNPDNNMPPEYPNNEWKDYEEDPDDAPIRKKVIEEWRNQEQSQVSELETGDSEEEMEE